MAEFVKITPVNGFDANDANNAMQNNYAWSMAELNGYIYVGTGRNIFVGALQSFGLKPPEILTPPGPLSFTAEIWRYKVDGTKDWERVYKSPAEMGNLGFRFMIRYEGALYAVPFTFNNPTILILKSTNGVDWKVLNTNIQGSNTRTMVIHQGKLYMGVLTEAIGGGTAPLLYVTTDPEGQGWTQISLSGTPGKNPRGGIDTLISFNNKLYVGTSPPGGFELWRTTGSTPRTDGFKLVVDKGAGDALNEVALTLGTFGKHLYVGTAIALAIQSTDPEKGIVPPKGADLIRVHKNDDWEVIVGSEPIAPTNPTTGTRNEGLIPSGFGDLSNAYIWSLREYKGRFYLGTFDWSDVFLPIIVSLFTINRAVGERLLGVVLSPDFITGLVGEYNWSAWIRAVLESLRTFPFTMGFDFFVSEDGEEWETISLTGLGNPKNYGLRNLFVSDEGRLYVGTANPFQGCEVWVKERETKEDD